MILDSPLSMLMAAVCTVAGIVAVNLLVRWIAAHTGFGTPKYHRMDPDEPVTIARFSSYIDAELWRGRLQAAGITCAVEGGTMGGAVWPARVADLVLRPGVKLLVRAADAPRAAQVLRS